jgi:uncharacterized protein YdaU (DUF1376 family)
VNYYERHLGDYAKDAGHLSMAEHGAYTLLLDRYYATEAPIPADLVYRIAHARSGGERACVDRVLAEFFVLVDGSYVNKRAGLDIARYEKSRMASVENGKLGGRPKTQQNQRDDKPSRFDSGYETETQSKAHQTPVTSNQSRAEDQKQKGGKPPALTLPDWLPESAWLDWHAFRNQRRGWTHKARELSLATLAKLRSKGHDPTAVIEQSIERGWTGLFEMKTEVASHATGTSSRKLSAVDQVAEAIRDRRDADPFDDQADALARIGYG